MAPGSKVPSGRRPWPSAMWMSGIGCDSYCGFGGVGYGESVKRIAIASAAAFCVGGGFVLAEFVRAVRPVGYLTRPLLAVVLLAVAVGLLAALFQRWSIVVAVFVMAWIVRPFSTVALVVAGGTAVLLAYRLWNRRTANTDGAILVAVGVFFVTGLVPVVPLMSWSTPARADVPADGLPQYAILLDGYPRVDTLAAHGFDISPFIDALEDRGFHHYPKATSRFPKTLQTLSVMTTSGSADHYDSVAHQRAVRDSLRLPDGWVTIAPPMGFVTFPQASVLNPVGFTFFEARLLAVSLMPSNDLVLAGYRSELARSFDILASTERRRVFAHIFAPHLPALYDADGNPVPDVECRPHCVNVDPGPGALTVERRIGLIGGYVEWLNGQLIDVIDEILAERPDAEIVLFSDHGGRFDAEDPDEWHRVFLASRTLDRPDLFSESPHPGDMFQALAAENGK